MFKNTLKYLRLKYNLLVYILAYISERDTVLFEKIGSFVKRKYITN